MFLVRIILIFLFLYLFLYLAGKLFSLWLRNRSRKYQYKAEYQNRKEGDITIENKKNPKGKKFNKSEGEYVSFEEIEDN
jgi:hypothetical protein